MNARTPPVETDATAVADNNQREVTRLRAQLRDIVAVTALPAVWVGADSETIATSFVESLVSLLRLDFAYLRLTKSDTSVHRLGGISASAGADVEDLGRRITAPGKAVSASVSLGAGDFTVRTIRLEGRGLLGVLAAGDRRPGFPTADDELLLRVATNQAAIALRAAEEAAERERLFLEAQLRERQFHSLAEAAVTINSLLPVDEMLQYLAVAAAEVVNARHASVSLNVSPEGAPPLSAVYVSEEYTGSQTQDVGAQLTRLGPEVCETSETTRLKQGDPLPSAKGRTASGSTNGPSPSVGWLAAPLVARDGRNLGTIQLLDKVTGEFTETDESVLVQLAQLAAIAVETTLLVEEIQRASSAKDEFLGLVSHELRTPLTLVLGLAETLESYDEQLDGEQRHSALADLAIQARRLQRYIEDMFILARLADEEQSPPEPIVPRRLLERLLRELRKDYTTRVVLRLAGELPVVLGHATHIEQIVRNLVGNSVKYGERGTPVWITARSTAAEIVVTVSNRGPRVDLDKLPRFFEPFYRGQESERSAPGVGLGLAVCQRLVEAGGGRIWADPRRGGGMRVSFTIPSLAVIDE